MVQLWTGESNQTSAQFGNSVSSGDFNGDGYTDLLIGTPYYDNGESDEGRIFVYYGGPSGFSSEANWTAESDQASAYFGRAVSSGDFNGDGYDDVLVGAYFYDGSETDEGRVFVYYGSSSGISSDADWTAESNQAGAYFGKSVSSGDFNGDGYDDVLVGAHLYDGGETNEGRVFVYYGSSSGISSDADWTAESNQASAYFGSSVSSGDYNNDSFADVLVGAPNYNGGETNEGRAYVYLGSSSGISSSPAWTTESNQASAYLGWSVSSCNRNNSFDYVLVGAPNYNNGDSDEGRAYVYLYSQLPLYSNFKSYTLTTNFSAVSDLTNVTNLTLQMQYGYINFPINYSVNAQEQDYDSNVIIGDCYVSVNTSALDPSFNASSYLSFNNSDGHCGDNRIYMAPGVYNNADAIRQQDIQCEDCVPVSFSNGHLVKFKVYHFSSYAIGSNANLTIYDSYENSAAQPNADIIFYANYTNKSGSHISGATCTIYFDGNTNDKHNMTDNGNNYNYTSSFGSTGTHNYNITCSATNYNTLSAVDDVNVESGVVPEFSSLVLFLISLVALVVVLMLRHRTK